jgi:hypothetical protein
MHFNSFYLYTTAGGLSKGQSNFKQRRNPMTRKLSGKASFVTGTVLDVDGGFGA